MDDFLFKILWDLFVMKMSHFGKWKFLWIFPVIFEISIGQDKGSGNRNKWFKLCGYVKYYSYAVTETIENQLYRKLRNYYKILYRKGVLFLNNIFSITVQDIKKKETFVRLKVFFDKQLIPLTNDKNWITRGFEVKNSKYFRFDPIMWNF